MARVMTSGSTASPYEVIERLLAGIAAGVTPALAELYAECAVVELPFAQPGGLRLVGREQLAQHFARAGRAPFHLRPANVKLHQTTDPEVVVAEYDYQGDITSTGRTFVVANVQIVRVRDGLIVNSRDSMITLSCPRPDVTAKPRELVSAGDRAGCDRDHPAPAGSADGRVATPHEGPVA